ncbi:hypothetical protein FA13DRAFT_1711753 [Coprinellus micaceus]|uniref:Uncharacterized protein n=1 Tax=Coprinellus micaceus TaxID=71717 RepID=A0A4Y7T354_COPMI|nr:hypothetical protein FA13DRAFT_1711753 [Coprinellus micaceus]
MAWAQREMGKLQSTLCPIQRLPVEVHGHIFYDSDAVCDPRWPLCNSDGTGSETCCILLVCKAWRDTAYTTHKLWTSLRIGLSDTPGLCLEQYEKIITWFERSGTLFKDLHVHTYQDNDEVGTVGSVGDLLLARLLMEGPPLDLLWTLCPDSSSIAKSQAHMKKLCSDKKVWAWNSLRTLEVNLRNGWWDENKYGSPEHSWSMFRHLPPVTSFKLFTPFLGHETLQHCQLLQSLRLNFGSPSGKLQSTHHEWLRVMGSKRIEMLRLRKLRVVGATAKTVDSTLRYLKAPILEELDSVFDDTSDLDDHSWRESIVSGMRLGDAIEDFVNTSRTLELLHVQPSLSFKPEDLEKWVKHWKGVMKDGVPLNELSMVVFQSLHISTPISLEKYHHIVAWFKWSGALLTELRVHTYQDSYEEGYFVDPLLANLLVEGHPLSILWMGLGDPVFVVELRWIMHCLQSGMCKWAWNSLYTLELSLRCGGWDEVEGDDWIESDSMLSDPPSLKTFKLIAPSIQYGGGRPDGVLRVPPSGLSSLTTFKLRCDWEEGKIVEFLQHLRNLEYLKLDFGSPIGQLPNTRVESLHRLGPKCPNCEG